MIKTPNSRRLLDIAIDRLAMGMSLDPVRLRRFIGNVIVAQLLPAGVVKGGSALKLRFGNVATRYTKDLDAARALGLEAYISELEERLRRGWGGFTGRVIKGRPAKVKDVDPQYVMKPYEIKLDYRGHPWQTIPLELSHNEIGDADEPEMALASDVPPIFESLGLPIPSDVHLKPLHFQLAQKIHAVTSEKNDRVRDLVDLQLVMKNADVDLVRTRITCLRLFAYRKKQSWPPRVMKYEDWEELYLTAKEDLDVLPSVEEAIDWANELIAKIDASR